MSRPAYAATYVSEQVLAEGGPSIRKVLRQMCRSELEKLGEIDGRIRWRFDPFERDGDLNMPWRTSPSLHVLSATTTIADE